MPAPGSRPPANTASTRASPASPGPAARAAALSGTTASSRAPTPRCAAPPAFRRETIASTSSTAVRAHSCPPCRDTHDADKEAPGRRLAPRRAPDRPRGARRSRLVVGYPRHAPRTPPPRLRPRRLRDRPGARPSRSRDRAQRIFAAAKAALAYERAYFRPAEGNWPDLRSFVQPGQTGEPPGMLAWCHGAPGIGLARLALVQLLPEDHSVLEEAETAIRTTSASLASGGTGNFSLCHGDGGNADFRSWPPNSSPAGPTGDGEGGCQRRHCSGSSCAARHGPAAFLVPARRPISCWALQGSATFFCAFITPKASRPPCFRPRPCRGPQLASDGDGASGQTQRPVSAAAATFSGYQSHQSC